MRYLAMPWNILWRPLPFYHPINIRKPLVFCFDVEFLKNCEPTFFEAFQSDGKIGLNLFWPYETLCAIWYHLEKLLNMQNTHGRVLLSVKLQASGFCWSVQPYLSITPSWVFFTLFKWYKWYPITQSITYRNWD